MPQAHRIVRPIINPFSGVVSAGRAVLEVDPIGTYYGILLHHTFGLSVPATKANFITNIASIQVYLGGTVQWDLTPNEIISINEEKGVPWVDGILPLWFSQPDSLTAVGEDRTAWGMGNINNFQIVVNFNAVATPTLEGHKIWRDINLTNGEIITTDRQTVNAAGLTQKNVNIEFDRGRVINSVYCMTDQILSVEAYVGNEKIGEATKIIYDYVRQSAGYDPQTDIFVFSGKQLTARFTDIINGTNLIDQNKPHKLRLEFGLDAAAIDFDMIIEQVGPRKA
tara:strand:- start:5415 stop:6257 length:843 start_codon:yes stop_codon:yes gene_type:complete